MRLTPLFTLVLAAAWGVQAETFAGGEQLLLQADQNAIDPAASPVRRIQRQPPPAQQAQSPDNQGEEFRRIDGRNNNQGQPAMGSAGVRLRRWVAADYTDGISEPAGAQRLNPREVSNIVSAQPGDLPNPLRASDFLWQWGQFLDHDIDLTDGADPAEPWNILVPSGDEWFDPSAGGQLEMPFNRSLYDPSTGQTSPRQQLNEITAWIDASNVYGSDTQRADALRTNDGSGKLKTSSGNLLPFNTDGLPNAGGNSTSLFLAGDPRANEQVGLTVMHTLFVREHNRQAERIAAQNPNLSGEQIYQRARRLVGAMMQAITYREYLPALLGPGALPQYQGYDNNRNAGIANLFSTAGYRYGHSTLSPTVLRLNADGSSIAAGPLALRDAFFQPGAIAAVGGLAPYLRGLASQVCQSVDPYVIDDVRNFLFGQPGQGGFDLAALNIQRGRDHGLPGYNQVRVALGLTPKANLNQISSDPQIRAGLNQAYSSVDDLDLWVGGLAEDPLPVSMVGELIQHVLVRQFSALRDGDRFWYQRVLNPEEIALVENSRLSDIIRRNTAVGNELQNDVFHVPRRPGR